MWWTKQKLLDGIFYQLKNGCNWEDLPKDLPPYSTVYAMRGWIQKDFAFTERLMASSGIWQSIH